ncbi:hypothetical protein [Bacteroides uniformis]|uniref:hypothetical protein n=1 Tax=Bacteroides uniformis TaxID=820 RepID=UPI001F46F2F0|nr:hypothetical protein [Bacteroides uniformis]UVS16349.1 hypothetical protein NXX72_13640 [Bacteroides uniformis]
MITAVEIDELYYAEPIKTVTTPAAGLTGAEVATILKNAATKRVKNVHGWHAISCCFQGFECPTYCIQPKIG